VERASQCVECVHFLACEPRRRHLSYWATGGSPSVGMRMSSFDPGAAASPITRLECGNDTRSRSRQQLPRRASVHCLLPCRAPDPELAGVCGRPAAKFPRGMLPRALPRGKYGPKVCSDYRRNFWPCCRNRAAWYDNTTDSVQYKRNINGRVNPLIPVPFSTHPPPRPPSPSMRVH
jgi:hypothetical protein